MFSIDEGALIAEVVPTGNVTDAAWTLAQQVAALWADVHLALEVRARRAIARADAATMAAVLAGSSRAQWDDQVSVQETLRLA